MYLIVFVFKCKNKFYQQASLKHEISDTLFYVSHIRIIYFHNFHINFHEFVKTRKRSSILRIEALLRGFG